MLESFGNPGWGNAIVEAQLDWYGVPYVRRPADGPEARAELAALNPLGQVPTLRLPDGMVLTESAAITLWLADRTGRDDLVPGPAAPERAAFLRWLVYLVANIYPSLTLCERIAGLVPDPAARRVAEATVAAETLKLWRIVEAAAGEPWMLGARLSALDILIAVMTRWRPGRGWFEAETPRLAAIAAGADGRPELAACWARNFPGA